MKLSLNGAPCTLLFKIQAQSLAEPIPRCYSHKYDDDSVKVIVPRYPHPVLEIFSKRLGVDGSWEYKLIEEVPVSQEIKVLGGTICL